MKPDRTIRLFQSIPFTRVEEVNGDRFIEGYASTDAVDSYNEIIEPQAFAKGLPRFLKYPVLLLNHMRTHLPIGKVVLVEIRERGLWVRAQISKTADDIWSLIQEGILKGFSVGCGKGILKEPDPRIPGSPGIWKEVQLLEVSVVDIPANPETLFEVAAAKGFNLSRYVRRDDADILTRTEFEFDNESEEVMDEATIKRLAGEVFAAGLKEQVSDMVKAAVEVALKPSSDSVGSINRQMAEIKTALGSCATKAETQVMMDKVQGDASSLMAKLERLAAPGIADPRDMLPPIKNYTIEEFEKSLASERSCPVEQVRATLYTPNQMTNKEGLQDIATRFHEAHDDMLIIHTLMAQYHKTSYRGPRTLKFWGNVYQPVYTAFRKAMDSATAGEGLEWIPTDFSASLMEKVELELTVANKFQRFAMPTSPFKWPFASAFLTPYKQGESLTESATKYKSSKATTAVITFTAEKIAVRVLASDELSEDSIVAMLPWLRGKVVTAIADGIDNADLNGDTLGTQDSDFGDPADVRLVWDGLRKLGLAAAGSKVDIGGVTPADFITVAKLLGDYAGNIDDVHCWMNIREYLTMMTDTSVSPISAFGTQATITSGKLPKVYGIGVSVSKHQSKLLNASGVYDGSTMTKSTLIAANTKSFMHGDRRSIRVEGDRNVETGQDILVATYRGDFANMQPSQTYPTAIGYDAS